jgi:hypothetical protein
VALRQLEEQTMAHFSKAAADLVKVETSKEAAVAAVIMEVVGDGVTMEGVTSYILYVHYAIIVFFIIHVVFVSVRWRIKLLDKCSNYSYAGRTDRKWSGYHHGWIRSCYYTPK